MIYIEKDQELYEEKNLRVFSGSGNYEDSQLVEVYDSTDPDVIIGAFAAQFIRYGSIVYKFSNIQDLGDEILRIDPTSTHSMAAYVRMQKELLKQATEGSLENDSLDKVMSNEQINNEAAGAIDNEDINTSSESLTPQEVPVEGSVISDITTDTTVQPEILTTTNSTSSDNIVLDVTTATSSTEMANSTSTITTEI